MSGHRAVSLEVSRHYWAMALTQIDVDDDALAEAIRVSGAKTKQEIVNLALREYAARHRRVALEYYATHAAAWTTKTGR